MDFEPKYEELRYEPFILQDYWRDQWSASDVSDSPQTHGFFEYTAPLGSQHIRFFVFQDFLTRARRFFGSVEIDQSSSETYAIIDPELRAFCADLGALTNNVFSLEDVLSDSTNQRFIDKAAAQFHNIDTLPDPIDIDLLRLSILRGKSITQDCDASKLDFAGSARFLQRLWRLCRTDIAEYPNLRGGPPLNADVDIETLTQLALTNCVEATKRLSPSSYLAELASLNNELHKYVLNPFGSHATTVAESVRVLTLLMSPACPIISAELFSNLKNPLE